MAHSASANDIRGRIVSRGMGDSSTTDDDESYFKPAENGLAGCATEDRP